MPSSPGFQAPDLSAAKQTVQSVSSKAGAYIGSWGTWMGEKRKTGWGSKTPVQAPPIPARKENLPALPERPKTNESYKESLFDADGAPSPKKNEEGHVPVHKYPVPSRFHEAVDENTLVSTPVVDKVVAKEAKEWEDESDRKVDAEERNSKVVEALEAASGTPIS